MWLQPAGASRGAARGAPIRFAVPARGRKTLLIPIPEARCYYAIADKVIKRGSHRVTWSPGAGGLELSGDDGKTHPCVRLPEAPDHDDRLRLTAGLDGTRVRATLENVSAAPVEVWLGWNCRGPEPFEFQVDDGPAHGFGTEFGCFLNSPILRVIPPSGKVTVLAEGLGGGPFPVPVTPGRHVIRVGYFAEAPGPVRNRSALDWHGLLSSPPVEVDVPRPPRERVHWHIAE